jgi:hypothetical protein
VNLFTRLDKLKHVLPSRWGGLQPASYAANILLAICLLSVSVGAEAANAAEPVVSAWIRSSPAAGAELRKVLPDVHEVLVDDQFVEIRSAGLSLLYLGPFQNPLTGDGGLRDLRFRIPRKPVLQEGDAGQRVGPGVMGVFLNGVPLYNRFAEASSPSN